MSTAYDDPPVPEAVAAPAAPLGRWSRVSWPAIFAGIVLVLAIEILLDVLGAGVGLGLINPGTSGTPSAAHLGTGAGVWWLISTIIALLFGCYAAARLARVPSRWDGVLHGLVIWGGAVLITVYLLTSAVGGVIGGAFSVIGGTVSAASGIISSTAGGAVKAAVPQSGQGNGLNAGVLKQQAEAVLASPTPQNPANMSHADAVKAVGQALPDLVSGGNKAAAAKTRIAEIVAAQAHISPQDAQKRVADAEARLTKLKAEAVQTATHVAKVGAKTASHAALLAFAALLIGAIAAGIGGALASPQRLFVARRVVPPRGTV